MDAVYLSNEGGGAVGGKGLLVAAGLGARATVGNGEADVAVVELLDTGTDAVLGRDDGSADDLDRRGTGTVKASHLLVELLDGANQGDVAELLGHVVSTTTGVVAEGDGVVLDDVGVLLEDLVHGEDLTGRLLHLLVLMKEIPEARLGGHLVGREDLHAVELRHGVRLSRGLAADHAVVLQGHLASDASLRLLHAIRYPHSRKALRDQ